MFQTTGLALRQRHCAKIAELRRIMCRIGFEKVAMFSV
jgi:hypothetical protein